MKESINCEPLLFIETINDNVIPKNQEVYDSRYKNERKIVYKTHDSEFYIKLNRLVLMYNKNKKIVCKVLLLTKEEYIIVVTKVENNILYCNIENTNKCISFDINQIDELTIEQIN